MINDLLKKQFQTLIKLLQLRQEKTDFFRIRSYQKVVDTLDTLTYPISEIVDLKTHTFTEKIDGFGKNSMDKIIEFIEHKKIHEIEKLLEIYPQSLINLTDIQGLGPKTLRLLHDTFHIQNSKDLKKALKDPKVYDLPRMGEKTVHKILHNLEIHLLAKQRKAIGDIYTDIIELKNTIQSIPEVQDCEIAGSFRRFKESVGDIDILITCHPKNQSQVIQSITELAAINQIINQGETKITALIKDKLQVDFRIVKPEEFGSALMYFTGSKQHNILIRKLAIEKQMKVSEYGIFDKNDKLLASQTEQEIYKKLGLNYIPPENRLGTDEIAYAKNNNYENQLQITDIQGDLHLHSTYSDGRNTIFEMAQKAQKLNYQFLAITDHSKSLKIASGLSKNTMQEKLLEIQKIQTSLEIQLLMGTEVDIMPDGSLDYSDQTLNMCDIVVASVHQGMTHGYQARILKAIENPHVTIIGHLTGREYGKREAQNLDFDLIFKACHKNQVVLEINCQPRRFDINWKLATQAKKHNCLFSINTDAHSTKQLDNMHFGIKIANKAMLNRSQIINTWSVEKLKQIKKQKLN